MEHKAGDLVRVINSHPYFAKYIVELRYYDENYSTWVGTFYGIGGAVHLSNDQMQKITPLEKAIIGGLNDET